ncbi:MAG: hypothetical protein ACYCW6_26335 [Candidatus Xenobia bacterium]
MKIPSSGSTPVVPHTRQEMLHEAKRLDRQADRVEWRGALYETLHEEIGSMAGGCAVLAGIGVGLLGGFLPGVVAAGVVGIGLLASAPVFKHMAEDTEEKWDNLFNKSYDLRQQAERPQAEILPSSAAMRPLSYPNPRIIDADYTEV